MGKAKKERAAARRREQGDRAPVVRGRTFTDVEMAMGATREAREIAQQGDRWMQTFANGARDEEVRKMATAAIADGTLTDPTGRLSKAEIAQLPLNIGLPTLGSATAVRTSPSVMKQLSQRPEERAAEARRERDKDHLHAWFDVVRDNFTIPLAELTGGFIFDAIRPFLEVGHNVAPVWFGRVEAWYIPTTDEWKVKSDVNGSRLFSMISDAVNCHLERSEKVIKEEVVQTLLSVGSPMPSGLIKCVLQQLTQAIAAQSIRVAFAKLRGGIEQLQREHDMRSAGSKAAPRPRRGPTVTRRSGASMGMCFDHFDEARGRVSRSLADKFDADDAKKREKARKKADRRRVRKQRARDVAQSPTATIEHHAFENPVVRGHVRQSESSGDKAPIDLHVRECPCDHHPRLDLHGYTELQSIDAVWRYLLRVDLSAGGRVGIITGKGNHSPNRVRVIHPCVEDLLEGWGCRYVERCDGFTCVVTTSVQGRINDVQR